jgi:hypothetical protein
MDHKSGAGPIEIKSADQGTFSAVFATFGVIDKDGDVTDPGAFTNGAEVLVSSYQHKSWDGALPIGTATIRTTATEAIVDGKFFLDTAAGMDTWTTLKHLGSRQEWSYGFDIEDAAPAVVDGKDVRMLNRMKVHEVSPVLIGAGVNTRTLDIKARKETVMAVEATYAAAIRPHETRVNAKRWDLKAAQGLLPSQMSVDDLRSVHAFVKADGDPTDLRSYGYLHHDSVGGEANLRACLAGIAEINGSKSAGMSPAERKAVYDHLAQHLDDGDRDAPDFKATPGGELKFHEEAADVLMRLDRLIERTSEVMALRRAKGKAIAASTIDVLEWVGDSQRKLRSLLDSPQEDADREYAKFVRSLHDPQE